MDWAKTNARQDEKRLGLVFGAPYIRGFTGYIKNGEACVVIGESTFQDAWRI